MLLGTSKEKEVLRNWRRRYEEIRRELPLSFDLDSKASELAVRLYLSIGAKVEEEICILRKKILGKEVDVVGAYDTAEDYFPTGDVIIGVEGGAYALIKKGIIPDVIVTDLDGPMEVLAKAPSTFFVHFHGDNIEKATKCPPEILSRSIPTVQTFPFGPCLNLGGFTDGDRAAYLAALFGARRIRLFGFNFHRVGKYSYSRDLKIKLCKLRWAEIMLEDLERIFGELIRWERRSIGSSLDQ